MTKSKLKARPAVRVVRQDPQGTRIQAPHTLVSDELAREWDAHFTGDYGASTTGVELGMIAMLYLTGSPRVSASRLVELLCRTYPDNSEILESNTFALADAFKNSDGC